MAGRGTGTGRGLTQRQHPVLTTVRSPNRLDGGGLRLHTAGKPGLIEVAPPGAQTTTVKSHATGLPSARHRRRGRGGGVVLVVDR